MQTQAKAPSYDWKSYNQKRAQITIRMDREEKAQLDAVLQRRGESVSELLLAYLRPIITEGTPEGQRAHEIISAAVQESIAWNKSQHNGGFGDTEPEYETNPSTKEKTPKVQEWRSPDIIVRPRITKGGDRVLYHVVTQRTGMSRQDAIRRHVNALLNAWADLPESSREDFLSEIANPEYHRFVISYSGFDKWIVFSGRHEMAFHQLAYQQKHIATPANDDEAAFVKWAADYLLAAWNKRRRSKSSLITICEGDPDAWAHRFNHYEINSDADNISAWAGLWLNDYRELRAQGIEHETAMSIEQAKRIQVQMLTITTE
jgi:hypothetical protein